MMLKKADEVTARKDHVRFPIALKLILATVALVAGIAIGFVVTDIISTQRQYAQMGSRLRASEIDALKRRGIATSVNFADSSAVFVFEGDASRVRDIMSGVKKGDAEILEAAIVRADGTVFSSSGRFKLGEVLPEPLGSRLKNATGDGMLEGVENLTGKEAIAFHAPIALAGRKLGEVYLEMSTARVTKALQEIEKERRAAMRRAVLQTLLIGTGALVLGILVAVLQSLRFSRAIRELAEVATEVGNGNLKVRAERKTNDEIGILCDRFNDMTGRIENLLKETAEKLAIDKELERANQIQALLMPSRDVLQHAGFSYTGFCQSATQMGGDWWHHYPLGEDRVMLCVGDVTGHGIPSAMLTASAKACCDTMLYNREDVNLNEFMTSLDYVIRESGKGQLVMTLFACVFDKKRMTVDFINAGHNFPMLFRDGQVKSLVVQGCRLGDGGAFQAAHLELKPNDLVALYTDGIIECTNPQGQEYGARRFKKFLQAHATQDLPGIRDGIIKESFAFFGPQPRADDITLVLCRV